MEESYHMRYFEGKIPSKDRNGQYIELDAKNLRSSLLDIMKNEVSEICASRKDEGFQPPHMQVSDNSVYYQHTIQELWMIIINCFNIPIHVHPESSIAMTI